MCLLHVSMFDTLLAQLTVKRSLLPGEHAFKGDIVQPTTAATQQLHQAAE